MNKKYFLQLVFLIAIFVSLQNIVFATLDEINTLYKQGVALAAEGKFDEATHVFQKILERDKTNRVTLKALQTIHDIDIKNIDAIYAKSLFKALSYIINGQDEKGINVLNTAIKLNPHYAEAYHDLGVIYYSLGRISEAQQQYRKAIKVNPQYPDAYNSLGYIDERVFGNQESALTNFNKALERDPSFAEAYSNLGLVYENLGKLQEAIASYQKSIELGPNFPKAYNNLAYLYASLGDSDKAFPYLQKAIEIDPKAANAYALLGMIYFASNKFEEAKENLITAKELFIETKDYDGVKKMDDYLNQIPK